MTATDRPTAAPIDWDNLAEWVAGLEPTRRATLADALRDHESAGRTSAILEGVRETLAEQEFDSEPVAVVFTTDEWDNGHFLTTSGKVTFADGSTDWMSFDTIVDALTDEFGTVGSDFAMGINLRTGDVETDDYHSNVLEFLGLKN